MSFERDGLDLHHSNQTTVSREFDLSNWALRAGHLHRDQFPGWDLETKAAVEASDPQ